MRWPAIFTRRRDAAASELRQTISAQIDTALAQRKAHRAARQAGGHKAAATKVRQQIARDPLFTKHLPL